MAQATKVGNSVDKAKILLRGGQLVDCDIHWMQLMEADTSEQVLNKPLEVFFNDIKWADDGFIADGDYVLKTLGKDYVHVRIAREDKAGFISGTLTLSVYPLEGELRRSLQSSIAYSEIMNFSPDIIFGFDRQYRHTFANARVYDILGIRPQEMIGKTHEELGFSEEESEYFEKCIDSAFQTGREKRFQFSYKEKFFDWYLMPVKNKEGVTVELASFAREVSELRNVQDALADSQKNLAEALKITKLAWWRINPRTRMVYLNPHFKTVLGVKEENFKDNVISIEDYLERFVPADQRYLLHDAYRLAVSSDTEDYNQVFEYTLMKASGERIQVRSITRLDFDENNQLNYIYGTIQDITELWKARKEVENYRKNLEKKVLQKTAALRKSEAKLHDALNLANLATWEYDFENKSFKVGRRVLEILGIGNSEQELSDLKLTDFLQIIHPDDRSYYLKVGKRTLKATDENFSDKMLIRIIRPDGDVRKLFLSIKVILDENGWHTMHYGTIQDVTEIYNAEKTLNRLSNIIEATPDIVFVFRRDSKVLYINKAGKDFWGLNDEKEYTLYDLFNSKQINLLNTHMDELDEAGYYKGENVLQDDQGLDIPVNMVIIVHPSEDGEPNNYSVTITDISQIKKTQEQLVYKNHELDTFLYRASHDLRGPVASMAGLNQLAEMEIDDPKAIRFFDMFRQQISRLNDIISTLAELTNIKERELVVEEVNFEELVYEVIASLYQEPKCDETDWHVSVSFDGPVSSDRSILTVILYSLLENSLRYAPSGEAPRIQVQARLLDENRLVFFVDDNGVGIEKTIQSKVFNMFFRGHEMSSGSGLGLYLLRNAVDRLRGSVFLSSEPGIGTTFRVEVTVNVKELDSLF